MSRVSGKVVIVTGASSGIGRATAILLAQKGCKVVVCARREDRLKDLVKEITEAKGVASYKVVDVTKKDQVQAVVDYTVKTYGKVDVLFNNAGVMLLSSIENEKVEEWDKMIDVNIKGVLYGIAAAVPVMLKQGFGHIINTGSVASLHVTEASSVYCGTKFAVRAITEGLKLELGGKIKSTLICPGATHTELGQDITDSKAADLVRFYRKNAITSEDVANTVLFAIDQENATEVSQIVIETRPLNK